MELYRNFTSTMNSFFSFETHPKIAVAVSGGADSMALMLLTYAWIKEVNGTMIALTLDHKLRTDSTKEALFVEKICRNLGIDHTILDWSHDIPITSNVQAKAREARYSALSDYCKKHDILTILTAHHYDDKVENFLIRLFRGSGLMGLSSHEVSYYNNVRIVRPLFNFKKIQLENYLSNKNISWCNDPSNSSEKYLRTSIRQLLDKSSISNKFGKDLIKNRLSLSQFNLTQSLPHVRSALITCYVNSVTISPLGFATINLKNFSKYSQDLRTITLSLLLSMLGGKTTLPRHEAVQKLESVFYTNCVKTLHGCIVRKKQDTILIYREYGKHSPDKQKLANGEIWDNRFQINFSGDLAKSGLVVDKFNAIDYTKIKREKVSIKFADHCADQHKWILFSLPVIRYLEKVVSIPHIEYYDCDDLQMKVSFTFKPSLLSRWLHF